TPSGDQAAWVSAPAPLVSCAAGPPAPGIRYRSPPPLRALEKTSLSDAGDQSPRRSSAGLLVRFVWCEPSVAIVNTSQLPVRSLSKAIALPFGAQRGLRSEAAGSFVRSD